MAKTIFILGAGASHPYGFPLGKELVNLIVQNSKYKIDHRHRINATPNYLGGLLANKFEASFIDSFRNYLRRSDTNSIDSFLTENPQFLEIGKACIAYILLECESVYIYDYNRGGDWYNYFGNILTTEDPDNFDFKIYTFNYDRCLDHFFQHKAESFFVDNETKQDRFLKNITITHLHGSLGDFKFGNIDGINDYYYLENVASNIKIISEVEIDKKFESLQQDIRKAHHVIFLGFGFHPLNMKRIGLADLKFKSHIPKFYASTYCLEEMEVKTLYLNQINNMLLRNNHHNSLNDIGKWMNEENYMFLRKMISSELYFAK